jgi:hypothetical protein
METKMMRFDYIFSYWIFLWWILYQMKITDINPKLMLIIALLYIIFVVVTSAAKKTTCHALPFFLSVLIIKLYPLYTLRNTEIKESDIYYTFFFFLVFMAWLTVTNGVNKVYDFYSLSLPGTLPPFEYYFNKLFDKDC